MTPRLSGVRRPVLVAGTALCVLLASWWYPASAQTRPRTPTPTPAPVRRPVPRADQGVRVRAYGLGGVRRFAASQTFEAVMGSSIGPLFGGGVEVLWGRHLSVGVDVSRYSHTGERVFVSGGEVFQLGIPATVTVVPVAATASYRFATPRSNLIPFLGGGINWHRYTETSDFAAEGEDVSSTFAGVHAEGGAEWRVSRMVGVAGVGRWSTVRDAFGTAPSSAATAFGEHDLGGFDATVRVIIGRR